MTAAARAMPIVALRAVALLVLIALAPIAATALPDGRPPQRVFTPDLDIFPQNFAIAVDDQSRVYIGNKDGVLIYDGEYWQLVPTSNGDLVRSLAVAGDRVYVGGYDAFGYIERTRTGHFTYQELSSRFESALDGALFADIWRIAVTAEAIYFVALKHLFRYEPRTGESELVVHEGRFGEIADLDGRLLLQFRGEGLREYRDGVWVPVPSPGLARLLSAMPVMEDGTLVTVDTEGSWHRFDGTRFEPLPHTSSIPYRDSITDALALGRDMLVLTTQLGKVVFHDLASQHSDVLDVSPGFIPDLAVSPAGEVLIVDNLGFHAVTWPAPWKRITDGLSGTVHRFMQLGEDSFVLTSSGAFVARAGAGGFERLDWTAYEAWDLLPLEDGSLLFADSYRIYHLQADGSRDVISDRTTARVFTRSSYDPDVVYVGTELGLEVLQRTASGWVAVYRNDRMDNLGVTHLVETAPYRLWIGSARGGIRRIRFSPSPVWTMEEQAVGLEQGLDYGGNLSAGAHVYVIDGVVHASTARGIYRWREPRFEPTSFQGLAPFVPRGETIALAARGGERWAFTHAHLFRHDGSWVEEDVSALRRGAFSLVDFVGEQVVVGALGSLMLFDRRHLREAAPAAPLDLSSAVVDRAPGGGEGSRALPLDAVRFASDVSRLTMRFGVVDLRNPERVAYRTRLLPQETGFSPWSDDSQQSFVALPPGSYTFEIEARDSRGQLSSLRVPIEVRPQWFQTAAVRVAGLALAAFCLYALAAAFARQRSRALAAERDRLEQLVEERTRALVAANLRLEEMAHLDELTQIPNRRRLDAYLERVRAQCAERSRVLSLAVIDVDHFKQFNDSFGHQAGDDLLSNVARLLSSCLRRGEDLVARYGGEEFIVVLPGADAANALAVVEEMRSAVARARLGVTISAGLHTVTPDERTTAAAMIAAADAALYRAKHAGRDRVEAATAAADADAVPGSG